MLNGSSGAAERPRGDGTELPDRMLILRQAKPFARRGPAGNGLL